jgi:hypothetical protein
MAFIFEVWHNLRPGETARRKWIIPDRKVGERYIVIFGAPKVVASACVD